MLLRQISSFKRTIKNQRIRHPTRGVIPQRSPLDTAIALLRQGDVHGMQHLAERKCGDRPPFTQVSGIYSYPISHNFFRGSVSTLHFTTNQETSRLRTKMIMRSSFSFPQCLLNGFQVLLCNLSTATQSLRQISSMATSFNHHLK